MTRKQQALQRRKKKIDSYLRYKDGVRIGTLNCRGIQKLTKREQLIKVADDMKLDIMLLQETNVNTKSMERKEEYTYIFSTSANSLVALANIIFCLPKA